MMLAVVFSEWVGYGLLSADEIADQQAHGFSGFIDPLPKLRAFGGSFSELIQPA